MQIFYWTIESRRANIVECFNSYLPYPSFTTRASRVLPKTATFFIKKKNVSVIVPSTMLQSPCMAVVRYRLRVSVKTILFVVMWSKTTGHY